MVKWGYGLWYDTTVGFGPFADLVVAGNEALGIANGMPFWKLRLRLKSVSGVVVK